MTSARTRRFELAMERLGQSKDRLDVDEPAPAATRDTLFADLVERANDLFIVVGRDGRIQFVNQSFCALTGLAREEVEGEKLVRILDAGARQSAQNQLT